MLGQILRCGKGLETVMESSKGLKKGLVEAKWTQGGCQRGLKESEEDVTEFWKKVTLVIQ